VSSPARGSRAERADRGDHQLERTPADLRVSRRGESHPPPRSAARDSGRQHLTCAGRSIPRFIRWCGPVKGHLSKQGTVRMRSRCPAWSQRRRSLPHHLARSCRSGRRASGQRSSRSVIRSRVGVVPDRRFRAIGPASRQRSAGPVMCDVAAVGRRERARRRGGRGCGTCWPETSGRRDWAVGQPVFVQCQVRSILVRESRRYGESPGKSGDLLSVIRYTAGLRTMNHCSRIPAGRPGRAIRSPGAPSSRAGRAPRRSSRFLYFAVLTDLLAGGLSR
jgi:hypothetical protein